MSSISDSTICVELRELRFSVVLDALIEGQQKVGLETLSHDVTRLVFLPLRKRVLSLKQLLVVME